MTQWLEYILEDQGPLGPVRVIAPGPLCTTTSFGYMEDMGTQMEVSIGVFIHLVKWSHLFIFLLFVTTGRVYI
jgi:hypothetical protein